jgi:hypothetical protein
MLALRVLGALLARWNLKSQRGDRQGAFRTASFVFATSFIGWALGASHPSVLGVEIARIFAAIGSALLEAGLLWLTYLGLEPYVRRYSPDSLLGWTRLVSGHWHDSRVAVDVLIGVCAGLAMTVVFAIHNILPPMFGYPEPMPIYRGAQMLAGQRLVLSAILGQLTEAITSGMLGVVGVVACVLVFRSLPIRFGPWLAGLTAVIAFTPVAVYGMFSPGTPRLDLLLGAGIIAVFVVTILRTGLLAAIVALFTHFVLLNAPITTDVSSWRVTFGLWYIGTVLLLGLGACYIARVSGNARDLPSS